MADEDDGFEPLFQYGNEQIVTLEDSDEELDRSDDDVHVVEESKTKKKAQRTSSDKKNDQQKKDTGKPVESVNVLDEDIILPPPPKFTRKASADPTQQLLRLKQAELLCIAEKASRDLQQLEQQRAFPAHSHENDAPSSPRRKENVLIKVQDRSGKIQSFRIGMDDKFEKLFAAYATVINTPTSALAFRFDGEQIMPGATPRSLDLENEDVVEAFIKSK